MSTISPTFRCVAQIMRTSVSTVALPPRRSNSFSCMIAEAIHQCSDRSNGPFVKVNCAAIPAGLLESELFGHERGAYTGALARAIGRFERANRGTLFLFLDEISDLPLELQPKLLRVIQERQLERLGGAATIQTDVRMIRATHRNVGEMVDKHEFRPDLFYRLSVFPLNCRRCARAPKISFVSPSFCNGLRCSQRSVILSSGSVLSGSQAEVTATLRLSAAVTLEEASRSHILHTLEQTGGVIGGRDGAAARLGLARTTLISEMRRLGVSRLKGRQRSREQRSRWLELSGTREAGDLGRHGRSASIDSSTQEVISSRNSFSDFWTCGRQSAAAHRERAVAHASSASL